MPFLKPIKCLPDAVQLLTPCTIGNGWLRIQNFGRFALTLYDKDTGKGIRVVLNPLRLEEWPEIKDWYYKLKPKEEVDPNELLDSIQKGGYDLCKLQDIQVQPDSAGKNKKGEDGSSVLNVRRPIHPMETDFV